MALLGFGLLAIGLAIAVFCDLDYQREDREEDRRRAALAALPDCIFCGDAATGDAIDGDPHCDRCARSRYAAAERDYLSSI